MTNSTLSNLQTNLLSNKVKTILFSIGLNEKYIAFDYLTFILTYIIKHENDSLKTYKTSLDLIMEKYNISSQAIVQSLNKILKFCNNSEIINKVQFKTSSYGTLNKIRVLKTHIENCLANF